MSARSLIPDVTIVLIYLIKLLKIKHVKEYKILIVDDYPEHIRVITDILLKDDNNYQIFAASNGEIAFDIAKNRIPHLIIMDWDMPVMNGMEATMVLKGNELTKDIPIIIASGYHTDSEAIQEALSKGAIDFVRKPIDKIELIARVHSMLQFVESFQELIRQKELNFKQEIIYKQKELTSQALFIAYQNEYLGQMTFQLKELLKVANSKSKKIIFELIENTNKKMSDNGWEQFEEQIDMAYNDFFAKLSEKFPELSANERKLCGLLRMNLSSKEIAQLIFQEVASVDVARYRLRQKLGLDKDENLIAFLTELR